MTSPLHLAAEILRRHREPFLGCSPLMPVEDAAAVAADYLKLAEAAKAVVAADDWINGEHESGVEMFEAVKESKAKIAALRSLLADASGEAATETTFPVVAGDVPPWFPPLSMKWVCACGERGDGVASNIAHVKEAHDWDGSPWTAHILDSPPDWYVALLAKEAKAKNGEPPQEPSR